MKISTTLSSIALVAAMTFSGSAFSQAMIGDVAIPEANMADFQAKCAAINSAATESLSETSDVGNKNNDAPAAAPAAGAAPAVDNGGKSDDGDQASEDNLDELLASMTPEQCKEAGLSPGAM